MLRTLPTWKTAEASSVVSVVSTLTVAAQPSSETRISSNSSGEVEAVGVVQISARWASPAEVAATARM